METTMTTGKWPHILKFKCISSITDYCDTCPRSFALPMEQINGIYDGGSDNVIIHIQEFKFFPNLKCGNFNRYIEIDSTLDDFLKALDGTTLDVGEVVLNQYPFPV